MPRSVPRARERLAPFRRPEGGRRRQPDRAARRAACAHRPERRRQDDAVQCDQRRAAPDRRADRAVRGRRHAPGAASARGARDRPHVSDHEALSRADGLREPAARLRGAGPAGSSRLPAAVVVRRPRRHGARAPGAVRPRSARRASARGTCPTATSGSSKSRCRWREGRGCCCWTSRWPDCLVRESRVDAGDSRASSIRRSPCCSSSTTWTSRSALPRRSPCSPGPRARRGHRDEVSANPDVQEIYLGTSTWNHDDYWRGSELPRPEVCLADRL